jgi:hypothetical protein
MNRNADFDALQEEFGIVMPGAVDYMKPEWKRDWRIAMDAVPAMVTQSNSGIPAFLTQMVDPNILRVLLAPNKAANILGEVKKGTWLDQTALFPVVERTGEVSSYGDFNMNGHTGVNTVWPQRQSYLYQTMSEYGELELERAGLAKISWVAEQDEAAVVVLNKFQTQTYFFGVANLQNYGLLNDPSLPAAITPATKAAGGVRWVTANNAINATANEVYADIQSMFIQLVVQAQGLVDEESKLVLAFSPSTAVALTATNQYNVNVRDLLKKNFPNIRFETAVQYNTASGQLVQMIAESIEGQETGYCAFNEKLRTHPVIRHESSFRQKKTQGTWGAIIRVPYAFSQMLGV